ncbi:Spermidine/putrescine transport system permease protein [Candidatus Desulfarcum epimagneticum]|uniref:Spermidine/putrescine transport system permease protein n=1 Tax=uncultured Desulfobacteraceae bacterium TaxID=218296 RepID=A0A484HBN2_9BACT|nr:Spermidine/putrescine transport system permease protein [uncultured Desulfobacteraceae bacterium]
MPIHNMKKNRIKTSPSPSPESPDALITWRGELARPRTLLKRGLALLTPGMAWFAVFLLIPGLVLIAVSFAGRGEFGELVWEFSADNYKRLAGFGAFGWTSNYLMIFLRSIKTAFVTTALCVAVSYPLAFFIAARPERTRYFWLTLVIIPFWTNMVIRAYAWFLILSPDLPFAGIAAFFGLVEPGSPLYPGPLAVYLGMVSIFLPFTALPIYAVVERLDWEVAEAARDLFASAPRVFFQAILPQTLPGLYVGIILSFAPAMGVFVIPDLLGGAKYMLVGNLIRDQFGAGRDWAFGAAVSMALTALSFVGIYFFTRKARGGRQA